MRNIVPASLFPILAITFIISFPIGIAIGVYIGWVQAPVEYRNSQMCQLSEHHQENYTLMVARGYRLDRDLNKAVQRLRPLRVEGQPVCDDGRTYQIDNIPDWVQVVTERYISIGANQDDICDMVNLADALNRSTELMLSSCPNFAEGTTN